jgi:hypothetical protein
MKLKELIEVLQSCERMKSIVNIRDHSVDKKTEEYFSEYRVVLDDLEIKAEGYELDIEKSFKRYLDYDIESYEINNEVEVMESYYNKKESYIRYSDWKIVIHLVDM